ncbi:hypothetical protein VO54_02648 [Elizabethkingia miricola]|nr:hypothetical protein VO54_02648 [Elizabethkingia miricola]
MRKLTIISMLFISFSLFGQQQVFQSTSYAYKYLTNKGWGEWSENIPTKANIYIDRNKGEIRIDSAKPQRYSLTSFLDSGYNKDNNKYFRWQALDQDGKLCTVMLISPTNKEHSTQFYFIYNEFKMYYNFFENANYFDGK